MRITDVIFVGSLAALVATTASAQAKSTQTPTPKPEEQATSSPCRAYQQATDGTWTQLPCQAPGSAAGKAQQQQAGDKQPGKRNPL
jgi:hypothetical protein